MKDPNFSYDEISDTLYISFLQVRKQQASS